jgi:hypothetical protein
LNEDKEPKRWQCTDDECKLLSKRVRTVRVVYEGRPTRKYVCYKCRANVKESDVWLAWHKRMVIRTRPQFIAWMKSRNSVVIPSKT